MVVKNRLRILREDKMKIGNKVSVVYENPETERVATPLLEELPLDVNANPLLLETPQINVGCLPVDPSEEPRRVWIKLYGERNRKSPSMIRYSGLEKLDSERYQICFDANNVPSIRIVDTEKNLGFLLESF